VRWPPAAFVSYHRRVCNNFLPDFRTPIQSNELMNRQTTTIGHFLLSLGRGKEGGAGSSTVFSAAFMASLID